MGKFALRCFNVEKSFPAFKELRLRHVFFGIGAQGQVIRALRNVSMDVPQGKIVGVLGKNGAGKSTLLRVLSGVYSPSKGRVQVNGLMVGLFELGGLGNSNLTGQDYAIRYLRFLGVREKEIPALMQDILAFSELGDAFEHRIRTYSSGMQARLYFATATASQSEIYLIDEILSVGDEHFQTKCWQRMRQRLLNGASGILVTHDWTAVLKLCEQAYVMEKGRFAYSGSSDKAVVSYLKLPLPETQIARFSSCNSHCHVVHSGQDSNIVLWVDVIEPVQVDFSISIETLRLGIGWEIVLLSDGIPIADKPGRYAVCVSLPQTPLVPGNYSLNVSISRRKHSPQETSIGFDSRAWTRGNGLALQVKGEKKKASVNLPFTAHKLGATA